MGSTKIDAKAYRGGAIAPDDLYITTDPATSKRSLGTEVQEGVPQQVLAYKGRKVRQGVEDVILGIQSADAEAARVDAERAEAAAKEAEEADAAAQAEADAAAAAKAQAEKDAKAAADAKAKADKAAQQTAGK